MNPFKIILFSIIIFSLTSCSNSIATTEQVASEQQIPVIEIDKLENVTLTNFSKEDLARYAMSSIMAQPSKKIKVRFENGLYYVSYIRKSDSKKFNYKIKIDGSKIVWANIDGRWRDTKDDERISFKENGNKLRIIQTFSDGSVDIKEYKTGE